MNELTIHNVPIQAVITAAKNTYVFGKVIRRHPNHIYYVTIMGVRLYYEDRRRRDTQTHHEVMIRYLRGESWEAVVTCPFTSSKATTEWAVGGKRTPVPREPNEILWGKERYFEVLHSSFSGNADDFQRDMLYLRMIDDEESWRAMLEA